MALLPHGKLVEAVGGQEDQVSGTHPALLADHEAPSCPVLPSIVWRYEKAEPVASACSELADSEPELRGRFSLERETIREQRRRQMCPLGAPVPTALVIGEVAMGPFDR